MRNWGMCILACAAAALFGLFSSAGAAQEASGVEKEKWDLVYLGDSWLPQAALIFGDHLEADLGVEVSMWQRNEGNLAFATRKLQGGLWNVVVDAEIIIVHISETTNGPGYCTDAVGDTPYRTTTERFRADVEAFLNELTARVDMETTIIRIGTEAILPSFKNLADERGVGKDCIVAWNTLNDQWREAAAEYGIPVVDVFAAWNGREGAMDSPSEYFSSDGGHLSDQGATAVAALMREMGYRPLSP